MTNVKFNVHDMMIFQQQKDFIDTAIVPLVHLDFSVPKLLQSSAAANYLFALTNYIEQQFKGRVVLLPPVCYTTLLRSKELIQNVHSELENAGFKHVFYMTSDVCWRNLGEGHSIIWMPAIPLESMDDNIRSSILEEQFKQIVPQMITEWSHV